MEITNVKVEVLLPEQHIFKLKNKLNDAGLLTIGNYDHVLSYSHTKGYWRPLENSTPFNGKIGEVSFGKECKIEFRCTYSNMKKVEQIIKEIHPYDEPIINFIPLLN
ncbi:YqfO family protein [Alkalicoccobacillus gibsonii]|uniref:cytochrome C biogenesis protein n=1 Tax=Alkalicoccobacillus gibsonii TaxID=79881 RepID=UPI001931E07E|nr:cytochrome C biogenesis protein [Alkalicoccobacillus gibsonii]MBM0064432.1 cytochrome C biogenesis protein [Alkalicoccobacillus gibsonii]